MAPDRTSHKESQFLILFCIDPEKKNISGSVNMERMKLLEFPHLFSEWWAQTYPAADPENYEWGGGATGGGGAP